MSYAQNLTIQHAFSGHAQNIFSVSWSPSGKFIASTSKDRTIRIWDIPSGLEVEQLKRDAPVSTGTWVSEYDFVYGCVGGEVGIWNINTDKLYTLMSGNSTVTAISYNDFNKKIAVGFADGLLIEYKINEAAKVEFSNHVYFTSLVHALDWHPLDDILAISLSNGEVYIKKADRYIARSEGLHCLCFSPDGKYLAVSRADNTVRILDTETYRERHVLEGHTNRVLSVAFSSSGELLATKSRDNTVRIWRAGIWDEVNKSGEAVISATSVVSFCPKNPSLLLTIGMMEKSIILWKINVASLISAATDINSIFYRNAKVVIVGEQGVGKSGLTLVLLRNPFTSTESTHGRKIYVLNSEEISVGEQKEIRELLLWDLAGQPDYRLIHQLHLDEAAAALVVFDARDDQDPFSRPRYWNRALDQATLRTASKVLNKFLVAARIDRGGIAASQQRIDEFLSKYGFTSYHKTSAKENTGVDGLRDALLRSISWEELPRVSSNKLFQRTKDFLIKEKNSGNIILNIETLYDKFRIMPPSKGEKIPGKEEFLTCVQLLDARGIVRRLNFDDLILMSPEYLDAYASAIVNAAKQEPDGLGSVGESAILACDFFMPRDERIKDGRQERLLLSATIEDLLLRQLALREHGIDGTRIIFPSQLLRENPDLPEPKGMYIIFRFEGPIQNIYATLAVRLAHSGLFVGWELWRNGVVYLTRQSTSCGVSLRDFGEGRGEIALFFPDQAENEIKILFESYVLKHLEKKIAPGTLSFHKITRCTNCAAEFTNEQILGRLDRGKTEIVCSICDTVNYIQKDTLKEPTATIGILNREADKTAKRDASLSLAFAAMNEPEFTSWLRHDPSLARLIIVFTDILGSTAMTVSIGDDSMAEILKSHFSQVQRLIKNHNGKEIKNLGDGFMIAFLDIGDAIKFSIDLAKNSGNKDIKVKIAIHSGTARVINNDIFGSMVNYTARMISSIDSNNVVLSSRAKEEFDYKFGKDYRYIKWNIHENIVMKGFSEKETLWSIKETL